MQTICMGDSVAMESLPKSSLETGINWQQKINGNWQNINGQNLICLPFDDEALIEKIRALPNEIR